MHHGALYHLFVQVIAPPAAQSWLKELGGQQVLRYRLLLNVEANEQGRAEMQWLFHTTGLI